MISGADAGIAGGSNLSIGNIGNTVNGETEGYLSSSHP